MIQILVSLNMNKPIGFEREIYVTLYKFKTKSLVLSHTFFGRNRVMIEGCTYGMIQGMIFMCNVILRVSYTTTEIMYFPPEKCYVVLTPERN